MSSFFSEVFYFAPDNLLVAIGSTVARREFSAVWCGSSKHRLATGSRAALRRRKCAARPRHCQSAFCWSKCLRNATDIASARVAARRTIRRPVACPRGADGLRQRGINADSNADACRRAKIGGFAVLETGDGCPRRRRSRRSRGIASVSRRRAGLGESPQRVG